MNTTQRQLLQALADGRFHSGETLGRQLGISRSAVWKGLGAIRELGLALQAVPGKGYRLAQPCELLEQEPILACLSERTRGLLAELTLLPQVDSTNSWLMQQVRTTGQSGHACLAEGQLAGRGRRGRRWVSPFGSNIYLSLAWRYEAGVEGVMGLSLAVAVALLRALRAQGVEGLGLKWPNDLYLEGRKLAGILIDLVGEVSGACHVVVGVGVNLGMPQTQAGAIDQPWNHLGAEVGRNRLAGQLLHQLLEVLEEFAQHGLEPFREEWLDADMFADRPVRLQIQEHEIVGTARGIDQQGALLVEVGGTLQRYPYGELSLRGQVEQDRVAAG
jgi:BirA family biotin operon repressor/biotin-[acetyl-CoA-carboxylase] ligase